MGVNGINHALGGVIIHVAIKYVRGGGGGGVWECANDVLRELQIIS